MAGNIDKFEDFLKLVNDTNPDISVVKDAILKHPEWLTDEDKLNQFFPERSKEHKGLKSLGLEKTDALKNVLMVAADLNKETGDDGTKKLSDDQLKKLVEFKNPDTNETAIECIKHNISVAGKKLNLNCVQQNETLTKELTDNKAKMTATMEAFKAVGLVKEEPQSSQENDNSNGSSLTVNATEEDMEVGGTANTQPLTVQGQPQPPKPEDINEAIGENPGEEDKGHKPVDFTPVKEGDIIDYMFNEWFLAFINHCGEKLYNTLDRIVDGYDAKPSHTAMTKTSPQPRGPQRGAQPPAPTQRPAGAPTTHRMDDAPYRGAADFMNADKGFPSHLASKMWTQDFAPRVTAKIAAIKGNIDKPADKWQLPPEIKIPLATRENIIQLHQQNPRSLETAFRDSENAGMAMSLIVATRAATLEYMTEHKDKKIDFNSREVQQEIEAKTLAWHQTITEQGAKQTGNPDYFINMDKSLGKLEQHLQDFHGAKKSKDKKAAEAKIDSFNMTKMLFQDNRPVGLDAEARRPSVTSPSALQSVQNDIKTNDSAVREHTKQKADFKRRVQNIRHPQPTQSQATSRQTATPTISQIRTLKSQKTK